MAKIKTKRERVKFASDNVAGACPEVLDAILKANDGDSTPYGNDPLSITHKEDFLKNKENFLKIMDGKLLIVLNQLITNHHHYVILQHGYQ